MTFTKYKSYKRLRSLAKKPIDLSKEGVLTPNRINRMVATSLNMKLFYGTERVDEEVMSNLAILAEESGAIAKMHDMQSGAKLNKIEGYESEDRMVLHTAMRDFFEDKNKAPAAKDASDLAYKEVEKLKAFCAELDKEGKIKHVVQVGIGGSDLGPRAIYLSLKSFETGNRKIHFLSNVDPDDAAAILLEVDLKHTLVVVVSKSGSTLETRTNEQFFVQKFKEKGIDPKKHMVAVTGKGSPMDNPELYRQSFYIWDYIGGRYSVTSMVGGVTIALAIGMENYMNFLRGASAMDKVALHSSPHMNLPLMGALLGIWNRNFLDLPTLAIIPYSNAMIRFPAHLQQCDMESNGKHILKDGSHVDFETGPIIWGEPGTNGQHSFYQLIHQGTTTVPVEFIGFRNSQYHVDVDVEGTCSQEKLLSNLFAQSIGLATGKHSDNPNKVFEGNRPNRVLFASQCDPYTVGSLLSYFENKVAFQGFIWGINSFDQEGVQLGKVLANQFIDLFRKKAKGEKLNRADFPLGQAFIDQIDGFKMEKPKFGKPLSA
ncbi:MAG: glucose-6-phosphate isomerase [Rhabdochlamydiaceae bacterium]|nr:glucose-6-phosphate isomerase [Candidatus Amphrikana amoebophyrae]